MTTSPIVAALGGLWIAGGAAFGQDWPARPLTMVVPFAAGGPVDVVGRLFAQPLGGILKQQIVIENAGGAGGQTGSKRIANAPPDGYQFVLGNSGTHGYNQTLYKNPLYNAASDFAPVGIVAETSKVLLARKNLPADNLKEFIAYAKANPGRLQFGSAGAGSGTHIACVLFNSAIGVDATHVPYRGTSPAMQDLMAGRIDYLCEVAQSAIAPIQSGQAKAIAILSPSRAAVLPDLPTAHEQGLTDFNVDAWNAFFFPKGTPDAIVHRLAGVVNTTLDDPAFAARLEKIALTVPPPARRGPDYLAKVVPADIEKWAPAIQASGAVAD